MVGAALDLLRWAIGPLALERVSSLLLSPYFARMADERTARAAFDAFDLRKAGMLRPEVSVEYLSGIIWRSKRRDSCRCLRLFCKRFGPARTECRG